MSAKYFVLLTHIGAAKLANATVLGSHLEITHMAVGDGGGTLPTPNPAQTALINEKRRAGINTLSVDPVNTNQIIAEQVIPENEGGFWIREIGLFDADGDLIAVANCAETYKPLLQEGSGRIQTVRMILIVSSTDAVQLKIDPAVVLATRGYVDDAVIEVKAYADSLMKIHLAAADPHPQYAPKASPVLTGKPTAPTAAQASNDTQLATTAFVKSAVAALINGAPGALDTLQELAKALGNDPNFSATVLAELAKKLPLSGGTMSGTLVSSTADALRMVNGGYGVTLRNDGGDFYLLLTDKDEPYGKWNSLRPFRINLTTGDVALGHNVDANTLLEKGQRVYSPNNKPTAADVGALTDTQAAKKYARLESPALIGKPTAPTAVQASNDTQIATTAFVKSAVAALVSGSPAALDTLQELAKAIGNDPNFSTTILNALAGKLSLTGGKMSGRLETNDIVKVTGAGSALPDSQGAFLCWNRVNGQGRTDFVNHRGSGSGGFTFWNGNHEALSELASLNASGALYVSGAMYEAGKRVYSPNNKPTAADVGALTDAQAAQKYALRSIRVNGKPLSADVNLLAGDINTWNKTEADARYLMKAATAAAATKLVIPRKLNGTPFDGTKDITVPVTWKLVKEADIDIAVRNSATKVYSGTIDTGVATTGWTHDEKKYAVVLSTRGNMVTTSNPNACVWGATAEVRTLTRFNSSASILIDIYTYGGNQTGAAVKKWQLWEMT
ncbi:phage tail protein [Pectobacterium cacticida]|uniref:phage tail protein n=1 Tax=Pectobacterium cacticida TaxID=69221 RepID=UPI002FF36967